MIADAVTSVSAREALRSATHDVHMRLHRHPGFAAIADGTIGPKSYTQVLKRLYGVHAPLENLLENAARRSSFLELQMHRRLRVCRLEADLRDLGVSDATLAELPIAQRLPDLSTAGRVVGALYVREGSTLGGQVLARALDDMLTRQGLLGLQGRKFLAGDIGDRGLWGQCCNLVEQRASLGDLAEMIAGATETFDCLETWFASESLE